VGVGTLDSVDQLLDDVRRRGAIGIAHRHVDDVSPRRRAASFSSAVTLKT
jgi:hypothetical protein